MKRRAFIAGLGSVAAWPVLARGQQTERLRRLGILSVFDRDPVAMSLIGETLHSLSELGWENGRNIGFDLRWAPGDPDRAQLLAREMVASQPDVLLAIGTAAGAAFQRQTQTIPIVFLVVGDPVGAGFVASLSRPGGNMTGFINFEQSLGGKLVTLLKTIAPQMQRAAAIFNTGSEYGPMGSYYLDSFEAAARSLAIEPVVVPVTNDIEIEQTITSLGLHNGGLVVVPNLFVYVRRGLISGLASQHNVPAILAGPDFARLGGLLDYGPNFHDMYRRAGVIADRILRGAKPSDLPVELPTRWELVINRKTAKTFGLEIPPALLALADEVIE